MTDRKVQRRLDKVADLSKRITEADTKLRGQRVELWRELVEDLGVPVAEIAAVSGVTPIAIYKAIQRARHPAGTRA